MVKKSATIKICITKYNNQLNKQNSNCLNLRKDIENSQYYRLHIVHINRPPVLWRTFNFIFNSNMILGIYQKKKKNLWPI